MKEQELLFLSIEDCSYSYPEMVDMLKLVLEHKGLKPNVEFIPAAKILSAARQRTPTLIIAGHRPFHPPHDKLYGGDIVKALKADPETRHIPVLMLEGLQDIERIAQECGADAYVMVPVDPNKFYETIIRLVREAASDK